MGAAVARIGPGAAGRGVLPCWEAEGLPGRGLPCALCLCQGRPLAVPRCWATRGERVPAVLRQGTPLQMETKPTWRDGRCFPREGGTRVYRP